MWEDEEESEPRNIRFDVYMDALGFLKLHQGAYPDRISDLLIERTKTARAFYEEHHIDAIIPTEDDIRALVKEAHESRAWDILASEALDFFRDWMSGSVDELIQEELSEDDELLLEEAWEADQAWRMEEEGIVDPMEMEAGDEQELHWKEVQIMNNVIDEILADAKGNGPAVTKALKGIFAKARECYPDNVPLDEETLERTIRLRALAGTWKLQESEHSLRRN